MTVVKFCGMTRARDLAIAIDLGVNAVGFVFWTNSPRHVGLDDVARLVRTLPPEVTPVGVFVRPSDDDVARAVSHAGIRVAQIHGTTTVPTCVDCELWMAAALTEDGVMPMVQDGYTVLLDAHDETRHGGTGRTIDWARAAHVASRRRVMLAGGLTPANVADAIRTARPFGVDVASGIEDTPGVKNAHAMHAFVAAVREADQ